MRTQDILEYIRLLWRDMVKEAWRTAS